MGFCNLARDVEAETKALQTAARRAAFERLEDLCQRGGWNRIARIGDEKLEVSAARRGAEPDRLVGCAIGYGVAQQV